MNGVSGIMENCMKFSVCVDSLFFGEDFIESLPKIKSAGIDHFEMWTLGDHPLGIGARNKNIAAIAREAKRLEMTCVAYAGPYSDLSSTAGHQDFLADLRSDLERARPLRCKTMIISLGGAIEPTDPDGTLDNAISVLREAAIIAQSEGVVLALEPLNSKVDHPHSVLSHAADGFRIVDAVDSASLKLLYDVYHQQIMDGNVTETIIQNLDKIVHFHAAGIPGRNELKPGELDYSFVFSRIADAGFNGFVGLEYEPLLDPVESLRCARQLAGQ